MPFAYYDHLSPSEKRIYDASDAVSALRIFKVREVHPLVDALRLALGQGDPRALEQATAALLAELTERLRVRPVRVDVLEVRPHAHTVELHGLYRPDERRIEVWMRTARKARVVAFPTYLRTVLHELCHHLDFTLLKLPASFHTSGFFRRESSLFHQLVPSAKRARKPPVTTGQPALPFAQEGSQR